MKLIKVEIHGYRRFKKISKMNVDGKLIALVGPNEAGKSSFLKALEHFNTFDDFISAGASRELTRGVDVPVTQNIITATFLLEDSDTKAIEHIPEARSVRWFTVSKRTKGQPHYVSLTPYPQRNLASRKELLNTLKGLVAADAFQNVVSEKPNSKENIEALIIALESDAETLPKLVIRNLKELSDSLNAESETALPNALLALPGQVSKVANFESQDAPATMSRKILFDRMPEFLFFSDDARLLQSEYSLDKVGDSPSGALKNFLGLANLDLKHLQAAIVAKDLGEVEYLVEQANATLKEIFHTAWSQSGITVRVRIDNNVLSILVREDKTAYVHIAERSDGLRQFVSLIAFLSLKSTGWPPILLLDEVETHLHYDAQADLIQMFARQQIIPKIIYTTHSLGCLPEDLGTGIRLIEAMRDGTSEVKNWFWDNTRQGFSPLLFGMGARTMAFIPVRYAVVTEGITDLILLPTLFREATGQSALGFQIVPGLSSTSENEIGLLEGESPRTCYLVDSDKGGQEIRKKLVRARISPERILSLPDHHDKGMVLEDFIKPEVFLIAVNEELKRSHGDRFNIPVDELPAVGRPNAVAVWCKLRNISSPNKAPIAYHILEWKSENPEKSILLEEYKIAFKQLYSDVIKSMGLVYREKREAESSPSA